MTLKTNTPDSLNPDAAADWVNVRDYGATGDGVTNDIAAFTAAQSALATAGGKIYVPVGTYYWATGFTYADKDVDIEMDPGAVITIGSNAITALTVPNGLTAKRFYHIYGGSFLGGNVDNQTLVQQADANSYGTVYFVDVEGVTNFRRIVYQSTGSGSFVQNSVVRCFFERCKVIPPTDGSVLMQTAGVAGTYGYPAAVHFEDSALWSEIAPGQKGWTFDYDGDILCEGYVSMTLKGNCKCDGLSTGGRVFALNGATADGTDQLECLGVSYDSADEIGNAYLDNIILKLSANSFLIDNAGLSSRSKVILNSDNISVVTPRIFFSGADSDYRIDILSGADGCEVRGGRLEKASAALIRTAALRTRILGVSLEATGAAKTILEVGSANRTLITGCQGLATGGGTTIIGANSLTGADNIV